MTNSQIPLVTSDVRSFKTLARMLKVHYMRGSAPLQMIRTDCGIAASRERDGGDECEAETVAGTRINVTRNETKVTCVRCRRLRNLP